MTLSPETLNEITKLASEMSNLFSPPILIPGCEVMDITDIDLYADNNGWIEAVCGKHNQQRCRWKGRGVAVEVGDYVDVLYFKSIRLFEVLGIGGTGAIPAGGNVWPAAGYCGISTDQYATWAAMIAALGAGEQGLVGEGIYTTDWTGGERLVDGADLRGCGIDVSVLTDADNTILEAEGESVIQDLSIINTTTDGGRAFYADLGADVNLIHVKAAIEGSGGDSAIYAFNFMRADGTLTDCIGIATGESTNNAIYAYESTVCVFGGYYDGDVYADRTSNPCAIYLYGPKITGTLTVNNSSEIVGWYYDANDNLISIGGNFGAAETFGFKVLNTSGGTRALGDVGYIDENGEFKTTTTAYSNVAWCVVLIGGANNADIYVARRGRVTVTLNGNCNIGDYLYTSTTAGQAQPQSYVRSELFAVALTANAGGAGGTCSALLLTGSSLVTYTSANPIVYTPVMMGDSTWVGTIATLPGGAVLTYNVVSGDENWLDMYSATTIARLMLHNTTRGDNALISDTVVATNTITLTAAVPGTWQVGDTITIRSQTNANVFGGAYYLDYEITTEIPGLTRSVLIDYTWQDNGANGQNGSIHSWEAYNFSKKVVLYSDTTHVVKQTALIPLFQRRFTFQANASGGGACFASLYINGYIVASP
jgi:hypothetical protein